MDLIDKDEALKALEEISYALWEIDIPSPTVPEYVEHHRDVQKVMDIADKWARKIQALPSAQPEHKKGKWIKEPNCWYRCSICGSHHPSIKGFMDYNFCPNCGAEMEVE